CTSASASRPVPAGLAPACNRSSTASVASGNCRSSASNKRRPGGGSTAAASLGVIDARCIQARFGVQSMVEQPAAGCAETGRGQVQVKPGQLRLGPRLHAFGEGGNDRPMAEAQCVEQVLGGVGPIAEQVVTEIGRQRRIRIEQGNQVPAAGGGGVVERTAAVAAGSFRFGTQREQRADGGAV